MKTFHYLLFFCFFVINLTAQSDTEQYSTVGVSFEDYEMLVADESHGLAIDHFHKNEDGLLEFIFSESELQLLQDRNVNYTVLVSDYKEHFLRTNAEAANSRTIACGLNNFDGGDMGGYHTYDQTVEHINSMKTQFPDLVNVSIIGESLEGRSIYAVKISDSVLQDESDVEGVVYFDALTHAREPMSLESTLYFMWWLLENYDAGQEASYLVNNREMYFVPIVNPDGYVFNEVNDPNGGGLWRKNRRDAGNGCFGVDLNRNYSKGWGLNSGSSNDPCTQIYRGEEPFSEPESAAVSDFVAMINPAIAFSNHTYGDKFLSPWGYVDSLARYEIYAEFVSEFIPTEYDGYGTTAKMLGYTSSGTTRDYLHSEGVFAWTPEIGHSFWEPSSVICDRVTEFLKAMKYLSWVCGDYACFHDFTLQNSSVWMNDTMAIDIRIKNRGLTKPAQNVVVKIETNHSSFTPLNTLVDYATIEARSYFESGNAPFRYEVTGDLTLGEQIPFTVSVTQGGGLSYTKEIFITAGEQSVLYKTDFESDNAWLTPALNWDTTFMDAVSGFHSFADSRYGNYLPSETNTVYMSEAVDLSEATNPFLSFNAKWSLEPGFDYATLLVSTNGITNWLPLEGWHTNNNNRYNENSHWIQEFIDLSDYIGESELYFALELDADGGVHSDGFYIDDFTVSDYTAPIMISNNNANSIVQDWKVIPNPNDGDFQLHITMEESMITEILIYDVVGRLLLKEERNLLEGVNQVSIQTKLVAGLYTVKLKTSKGEGQLRMVKQ